MAQLNLLDLSHVALNVTNMDLSAAFYRDVLGMKPLFEDELPDGMGFSSGFVTPSGVMVELIQITGLEIQARELTSTIAFSVSSLEAAKGALRSDGIEIKNEMDIMGIKMLFINDPDGHNIEICELPNQFSQAAQIHNGTNA